jgi:hypothetical protein
MKADFLLVNAFGSSQLDYSVVRIDCNLQEDEDNHEQMVRG